MPESLLLDHQTLQAYASADHPGDLVKILLEYMAREQDYNAQNELFRQLIDKHVALTNTLHEYIAQIEAQKQQLEELNVQKNELLGIAAHDLRNPLSAVQVYSELLLRMLHDNSTEKQQEFLERIHQSSLFMTQLIDDILDLSKIESGTLVLEKVHFDYMVLVQHNIQTNAALAEKKQITIDLQHEPSLPRLMIDPQKIEQVLNNLLSNAIKFSHPNTVISVRVFLRDNAVVTEVTDQGQGIPQEDLPHIFKTFHKASVQATDGEKSTGLGLAITKKIIEGHDGVLGVESRVGKGSTFFFQLPVAEDDHNEEENWL
jgi:signal transduction histidine kinase